MKLRKRRDDLEAVRDRTKLIAQSHTHVAVHNPRRTFGVEADVVERRAGPARREIHAAHTVLDEPAQDLLRARAVGTRHVRPADPRRRQRPLQAVGREVVQLLRTHWDSLLGMPLWIPVVFLIANVLEPGIERVVNDKAVTKLFMIVFEQALTGGF